MACLYPKKRSPFWYVKYTDRTGRVRNQSTGLRVDSAADTEKANLLRAEMEVAERSRAVVTATGDGWEFALPFLRQRCAGAGKARTRERYEACWRQVSHWLTLNHVHGPSQVTHRHLEEYLRWRSSQVKPSSGRKVSWNCAMLDIAPWSLVMQKAVWLGIIKANPLLRHGFKKEELEKVKPEVTDAEFALILPALKAEAKADPSKRWMLESFLIGMETGCRLRETAIPLKCVDFEAKIITFPAPKGGRKKAFSIPMPAKLEPLLRRMRDEGRKVTVKFPFQPSRQWSLFFARLRMSHLCFHCLRVTKVTRLRREGVPREVAMRLVNHSSELIHLLYDRHQVEDLRKWANAGSPSSSAAR
jgi:integrase